MSLIYEKRWKPVYLKSRIDSHNGDQTLEVEPTSTSFGPKPTEGNAETINTDSATSIGTESLSPERVCHSETSLHHNSNTKEDQEVESRKEPKLYVIELSFPLIYPENRRGLLAETKTSVIRLNVSQY